MIQDRSVYRYSLVREKVCEMQENFMASSPARIAELLRSTGLASEEQEHLVAVALNAKNVVLGIYTVSIGTADYAVASNMILYRKAIHLGAVAGIVMSHQHPSGVCDPSAEDIRLTESARQAGEIIGIKLLDHVIVSETAYFSFREKGML